MIERGDVYSARFPHASGARGKKRPVVIVQANSYNQRLRHAVVVQITTNLDDKDDPACLLVKAGSPEALAGGLTKDSLICGYLLSLMTEDRLQQKIGRLPDYTMRQVNDCLRAAMDL
jgi:mRNA-degrading endonuclease toxin of MazEF toxin-antitoxin module